MDTRQGPSGLPINSFQSWGDSGIGRQHQAETAELESHFPTAMLTVNSKGMKRKWGDVGGSESFENPSLVLGLGRPSSSTDSSRKSCGTAITMSSAKETDDESSMDICLNFNLNLGNDNTTSSKKLVIAPKVLRPNCDLQLSLSVGPSKSLTTTITSVSCTHQDFLENQQVLGPITSVQLVDEGSTSSRWKNGNKVLSYLHGLDEASGSVSNQMISSLPLSGPIISSSDMTGMLKGALTSSSMVNHPIRSNNTKSCQFPGCSKGARGASGFCIAHGGGRRCERDGCQKGAEGRTIFCKAHGGGRRCEYLGCTKSAEGRTDYCIAHGGGRRCSLEGCTRAARGKSGLCIKHGGGKRCQKDNCTKSAEGHSGLCISHGGGRRCKHPECTKGAQGSTNFCKAHGGGKRCTYEGCTKGAEGSTPFCKGHGGGKRCTFPGGCSKSVHGGTLFCVAHGGGKRCLLPECTKSARGRTDYCVRHGGGKRCKHEGCSKSAQGSTDFCKAHGGGNHCSWGQPGSNHGSGSQPCDHFARGKFGLCPTHAALVADHCVHGERTLEPVIDPTPAIRRPDKMKEIIDGSMFLNAGKGRNNMLSWGLSENKRLMPPGNAFCSKISPLAEGRVHGGSLLAMLADNENIDYHNGSSADVSEPEQPMLYAKNLL